MQSLVDLLQKILDIAFTDLTHFCGVVVLLTIFMFGTSQIIFVIGKAFQDIFLGMRGQK